MCVLTDQERVRSSLWDPPRPCPLCLTILLVLIVVLHNKTVIEGIVLSQVLKVILANYWT